MPCCASSASELSHRAARQPARYLARLTPEARGRFTARLRELSADPYAASKPLKGGSALGSARVGGWRIIFRIDDGRESQDVARIAPRGEVYREL